MTADGQTVPVTSEACNTKIVTPPAPEYQCTDLALTPVKNEVRTVQEVTTYSAANGAKYKSVTINWGDGSAPQTYVNPTETHQYANYGTYVVNVVDVNFTLPNGQVVTNTEPSCQKKSITFSHPSTPSYACVSLSVSPQNPTSLTTPIQGVATYSMTSGVTFVNVSYDWGDGQTDVVTTNSATDQTTASHTYSNYGTYTITATANFEVNGQPVSVSSDNCQTQINIPAPTCTVPGETNLPANSPECVPPTTPSGPLPNTGPGNVVAIFGGTTLLGTIGHFLYRRRFSHKAL
jgi:hypothetical protein